MISQQLLEILRCPMDPSRTHLTLQENHLLCQRCGLRFPIKDGFPVLVVEEAKLPTGCASLDELPCQREGMPSPTAPTESIPTRLDQLPSQREGRQS
jgi:uncharacterized protein YbaR (Trm112 family)